MTGFIKLHRGWSENDAFRNEPFCQRAAWVWLIEKAAWKDGIRRDPHGNLVAVKRGQMHTSTRTLGDVFGWSKNKVDRFLRDLETCGMLDRKTDQHGALITICNYEKYQGERDTDGPREGTWTDQSRTTQEERIRREEDKREETDVSSLASAAECEQVVSTFNRIAKQHGLPACQKLTPKRRAACTARIRDHGLEAIIRAIEHIPKSAFLRGEAGEWAGANIGFLLRPDTVTKILEGQYDDRPRNHSHDRANHRPHNDNRDGLQRYLDEKLGIGEA